MRVTPLFFARRVAKLRAALPQGEDGARGIFWPRFAIRLPILVRLLQADRKCGLTLEAVTARRLASAFVLYGLIATAFLAINMPPFQNPDEPAHFLRGAQIADGSLVGVRFSTTNANGLPYVTAGGWSDPELISAINQCSILASHPETRATRMTWATSEHWSRARVMGSFPNTAIYPPLFYTPSAIGILGGRNTRLSVVHTLIVSRVLTGVTAVTFGAIAIACAEAAAVWIFAILTLPMSLSLIASSSQDALLLACSALAGALWVRISRSPNGPHGLAQAALALALGLVAMARPPYVSLAILPLGLINTHWRSRLFVTLGAAALAATWSCVTAATALTNTGAFLGADPQAQLAALFNDPLLVVHVAWETLRHFWHAYLLGLIGILGWLDTILPGPYYPVAGAMMGVAATAAALGSKGERIGLKSRLVMGAGLLLSMIGVFAIQYLTWTVPGKAIVEGVQGRYFLPILLVGTGLIPILGGESCSRIRNILVMLVAIFPVISLAIVMHAVITRYYLQ